jgi:glycosyltransferase involved in cell wall biosynthesis
MYNIIDDSCDYPLISVILPVYNAGEFLRESINSILFQTYTNFELLIVYDHSIDDSLKIIHDFEVRDKRVRLIYGDNTSLIGALNKGLLEAKGEFIARMDADDVSLPNRFIAQVEHMLDTNADICGSNFFVINKNGITLRAILVPIGYDEFLAYLAVTVPFPHGAVMFRFDFLKKNILSYGSENYSEDFNLWIKFFNNGANFQNVSEFLFKYRDTETSLSKRTRVTTARVAREISQRFISTNYTNYVKSLDSLLGRYEDLNLDTKKIMLIGSFYASITRRSTLFFKVLCRSNLIVIIIFLYYLYR